jgi:phage head maturation protease
MIYKAQTGFQLKDINKGTREVVFEYATFGNLDRDEDISVKGMTLKSVRENMEDIRFLLDHKVAAGKPIELYETNTSAVAKCFCGNHTVGNDVLVMMDEGIIKDSSFGFETKDSEPVPGKRGKMLKQVRIWEVSVLQLWAANPANQVISVTKQFSAELMKSMQTKAMSQTEQDVFLSVVHNDNTAIQHLVNLWLSLDTTSDMYSWLGWHIARRIEITQSIRSELKWNPAEVTALKEHIVTMEKFVRNTKASDSCIETIQAEIKDARLFLSYLDTASTDVANQPGASELKELADIFKEFRNNLKFN